MFHSKTKQLRFLIGFVRKVHWSNILVVEINNREVSQHPAICKLMSSQIDFSSLFLIMNVVFSIRLFPLLSFKSNRKGTAHAHCFADRKIGCGFMVKKANDFRVKVDSSTSEFEIVSYDVELGKCE